MSLITIRGKNYEAKHVVEATPYEAKEKEIMVGRSPDGKTLYPKPQREIQHIPARLVIKFEKGYGPNYTPIELTGEYAMEAYQIILAAKAAKGSEAK